MYGLLAVVLSAGMLVGTGLAWLSWAVASGEMQTLSPAAQPARTVAVLGPRGFGNLSHAAPQASSIAATGASQAKFDWVSTAVAEMLSRDLSQGDGLWTVPRADVVLAELALAEIDGDLDLDLGVDTVEVSIPALRARLRDSLGADILVSGRYQMADGDTWLQIDLRADDASSGRMLAAVSESGTVSELPAMVARAGYELRTQLGAPGGRAQESWIFTALPDSPESARLYAEGMARLQRFDAHGARVRLAKAARRAPDRPLVHAALAASWLALGHDAEAAKAAQRAQALGNRLVREARLEVAARLHQARAEWAQAAEIFRTLHEFHPEETSYALEWVQALVRAGEGTRALEVLDQVRARSRAARYRDAHRGIPMRGSDPRVDLAEAEAAEALADHHRVRAAAERAAQRSAALGNRWLLARARYFGARAGFRLGELERAWVDAEGAEALFVALGDAAGRAGALNLQGNILESRSQLGAARERYELARQVYHTIEHQVGALDVASNLAILQAQQGQLDDAVRTYEYILGIARELGDRDRVASALSNLAWTHKRQGDYLRARGLYQDALREARVIGEQEIESGALNGLGIIARHQGELETSERLLRESWAISMRIGDKEATASRLNNLALTLREQGSLDDALSMLKMSAELSRELGDRRREAQRLGNMAAILRTKGRLREAERSLRRASEIYESLDDETKRPFIQRELALTLLAQGAHDAARDELLSALALCRQLGLADDMPAIYRALAQSELARGKLAQAERFAEQALRAAGAGGRRGAELDVWLLMAEIELTRGPALERQRRARRHERAALARADQALAQAHKLTPPGPEPALALRRSLLESWRRGLDGDRSGARAALAIAKSQAAQADLGALLLEIRLVDAAFGLADSDPARRQIARRELTRLAQDAESQGFMHLARRASQISQKS